jgi:glycosyltransferase involved in cell wall biosynthesis
MNVSVIIPAYNESKNIEQVIKDLKKSSDAINEIIVVDDGSTDDTAELAQSAGAKLVRFSHNKGKGEALKAGIKEAGSDFLLFIDGDCQDAPEDAPALFQGLEQGYEFVIGSRYSGVFEKGAIKKINYIGTVFFTKIVNSLFRAKISDSQAGFRAVKSDSVRKWHLRSRTYEIETEMLIRAIKDNLKILEVPVTRRKRASGKSRFNRIIHGTRILLTILRERFIY